MRQKCRQTNTDLSAKTDRQSIKKEKAPIKHKNRWNPKETGVVINLKREIDKKEM